MFNKVDILILELPFSDRDLNISVPIYLELKRRNINVKIANLHFSYYYILKYRPKLIFFSSLHDLVVIEEKKMLFDLGYPFLSYTTEGNFTEKALHSYVWGWNTELKLYQDKLLLWNQKSFDLTKEKYPDLTPFLEVVGSVGHDRYINKTFKEINLKNKYKKVIGIAGFGMLKYINRLEYVTTVHPTYPLDQFKLFADDRIKLNEIYYNLIYENSDTLFVLRYHPELDGIFEESEFYGLEKLENVLTSSIRNEYKNIDSIINACDIWLGYETNTSLESWLLNKPTIYINPTTSNFLRENHYEGNIIAKNYFELITYINEFYQTGKILDFESKKGIRLKILQNVIENCDGRNYQRACDSIMNYYTNLRRNYSSIIFLKLLSANFLKIVRMLVWKRNIYWKLRKKLIRPDYVLIENCQFAEDYIQNYSKFFNVEK